MKIEICVRDKQQYEIAKSVFTEYDDIIVTHNTITNAQYNTLISAGNSFGQMDGGVDGIINSHLSSYTADKYIHQDVQDIINEKYLGELPVGQSIILQTNHPRHRYLIYAPTMRVAEDVSTSINAYLAFRGALLIMKHANISAASTPLFCTGAGCMDVLRACKQMKEAYETVIKNTLVRGNWQTYHSHHRHLLSL
jgi:O-acetyl-ADP-ribose deacetylase (regulator of RNase III)